VNVLDLCSGYGGFSLALKLCGDAFRTVCYVERETHCQALLLARMEEKVLDTAPVWDDVTTFEGRDWRGVVDLVTAGYPCQPFSFAGNRKGTEDHRHLWPHIRRVISEVQPPLVFCENVEGHLNLGFEQVCGDLQDLGYGVEAGLFSAEEVGAPHRRKRLFFLAYSNIRGFVGMPGGGLPLPEECKHLDRCCCVAPEMADPYYLPGEVPETGGADRENGTSTSGAGRKVGHGHQSGLERWGLLEGGSFCKRPTWPPGPYDGSQWTGIEGSFLPVEPKLQRVADGASSRVDRLRAIGNGVVPLVAAYAFRTLLSRIRGS
jgi:DNA (cytosine-5)-methyltransferase 1